MLYTSAITDRERPASPLCCFHNLQPPRWNANALGIGGEPGELRKTGRFEIQEGESAPLLNL